MAVADDRRERAKGTYQKNLGERLAAAKEVATRSGPNSATFRTLDEEFRHADGEFRSTQSELHERPPHIRFENPWLFWIPAVIVFLMEAFINKIVIDMAAQMPGGWSLLISGLLSLLLVWLAHNAGVSWRQIRSELENRTLWPTVLLALGSVALIALIVVLLISLRAYFALVDTSNGMDIFSTLKDVAAVAFSWSFLQRAFTVPEALAIGGVNVLALAFAFVFAFLSHDNDKEYDRRYREMKTTRKARIRAIARYESEQKAVYERFKRPIARALRAFVANHGNVGDIEPDDFKAQRLVAERESPPNPVPSDTGPVTRPKPVAEGVVHLAGVPPPRREAQAGMPGNPW